MEFSPFEDNIIISPLGYHTTAGSGWGKADSQLRVDTIVDGLYGHCSRAAPRILWDSGGHSGPDTVELPCIHSGTRTS